MIVLIGRGTKKLINSVGISVFNYKKDEQG